MKNTAMGIGVAAVLVFALSGAGGVLGAPPEGGSDRLARKMGVLERIFDEVLEQSPNVLVGGGGSTRGLLLEGYGALFTFEGSVEGDSLGRLAMGIGGPALEHYFDARDEFPVPAPAPEPDFPDEDLEARVPESMEDLAESWETRREESLKQARERLAGLKTELTETLLDYGATLGELDDGNWVVVAAFLDGFGFSRGGPERLVLRVKMRDLRQYSAGQLSLEQATSRVAIEEQ